MITAGLDKVEDVPVVEVPMSQIRDWDTFHDTFAQRLGFPDFYGRTMDAWIDCLTYADEDDGMRAITAGPGEVLTRHLVPSRTALEESTPITVLSEGQRAWRPPGSEQDKRGPLPWRRLGDGQEMRITPARLLPTAARRVRHSHRAWWPGSRRCPGGRWAASRSR